MCVKPAALTTHSPLKISARPRTATRPSRALPLPHAAPTHARRPHNPFPAEDLRSPTQPRRPPAGCAIHSPQTAQPIPRRRPCSPPHSDTPFPSTSAPLPQRRHTPAGCAMHSPPTSRPIPRRRPSLAPAPTHTPTQPRCTPADLTTHSSPTSRPIPHRRPSPLLLFRFGHKKNGTAQWMCDAECLGRPSLRSVIGVGEPRAVRRRCGALAWRVGLRPQPWALRSRRCGRVLRA